MCKFWPDPSSTSLLCVCVHVSSEAGAVPGFLVYEDVGGGGGEGLALLILSH